MRDQATGLNPAAGAGALAEQPGDARFPWRASPPRRASAGAGSSRRARLTYDVTEPGDDSPFCQLRPADRSLHPRPRHGAARPRLVRAPRARGSPRPTSRDLPRADGRARPQRSPRVAAPPTRSSASSAVCGRTGRTSSSTRSASTRRCASSRALRRADRGGGRGARPGSRAADGDDAARARLGVARSRRDGRRAARGAEPEGGRRGAWEPLFFAVVRRPVARAADEAEEGPGPALHRLVTRLVRLFKPGGVAMGPHAWARSSGEPLAPDRDRRRPAAPGLLLAHRERARRPRRLLARLRTRRRGRAPGARDRALRGGARAAVAARRPQRLPACAADAARGRRRGRRRARDARGRAARRGPAGGKACGIERATELERRSCAASRRRKGDTGSPWC